jgi:NADH-quinone oxidoreductase subunit M
MALLSIIGIIYGALASLMQKDWKKLVAYSSVSHLGFCTLGMFALNSAGLTGSLMQMINHGLSTGALFLLIGMLYERYHTRKLPDYSGMAARMPRFGTFFVFICLTSVGLPGLNGFIGEFTIMQGTWLSTELGWRFVLPSVIGVIFAATYLLRMYRLTFMGDVTNPENAELKDITPREIGMLVALLIPIVVIGFYPNLLFEPMQPAVQAITQALATVVAGQ